MKTISSEDRPALVLVSLQKGFDDVAYFGTHRNNPDAERNAEKLLQVWRGKGLPLIHLQHTPADPTSPLRADKEGYQFKEEVSPLKNEIVIQENVKTAAAGKALREKLEAQQIDKIVVVGLSTDRCVSSTVRMAAHYGYDSYLVYDATATFDKPNPLICEQKYSAELIHDTAIASLKDAFANIVMTDQLIAALCDN